ncbi:helix-turn-helix transcriptional regulator [Streptomyces sp. NPDC088768]|uniref:helix-turn-helix transcriptional regulator n=1 Tax=Streptomyces sp. NPDC088768 TaxID=3365894 RepID=UPI0038026252
MTPPSPPLCCDRTQKGLAEKIGISRGTFQRIEARRSDARISHLADLAHALDCEVSTCCREPRPILPPAGAAASRPRRGAWGGSQGESRRRTAARAAAHRAASCGHSAWIVADGRAPETESRKTCCVFSPGRRTSPQRSHVRGFTIGLQGARG